MMKRSPMSSRSHLVRGALTLAALAALAPACKKPECRGQLSDGDFASLAEKAAKGDPACEELARAVVKIDDGGATVNGTRVNVLFHEERRQSVPPVSELLGADRERWLRIHPGKAFAGTAEIFVPSGTSAGAGTSVAATAAGTGYPRLELKEGNDTYPIEWWPGPGAAPRPVLHVEREAATKEIRLRFTGVGANAGPRIVVATVADAVAAIAKEWGAGPAVPRALALRVPNGSMHDVLVLMRELLAAPALAQAQVSLEIGKAI
ncbi:MAG: hypothetical protein JWP97_2899 [Labilithrix sp.]|nr:hypothetical protein [Labilithrix sp.]